MLVSDAPISEHMRTRRWKNGTYLSPLYLCVCPESVDNAKASEVCAQTERLWVALTYSQAKSLLQQMFESVEYELEASRLHCVRDVLSLGTDWQEPPEDGPRCHFTWS
jgi:hypothetical protein